MPSYTVSNKVDCLAYASSNFPCMLEIKACHYAPLMPMVASTTKRRGLLSPSTRSPGGLPMICIPFSLSGKRGYSRVSLRCFRLTARSQVSGAGRVSTCRGDERANRGDLPPLRWCWRVVTHEAFSCAWRRCTSSVSVFQFSFSNTAPADQWLVLCYISHRARRRKANPP